MHLRFKDLSKRLFVFETKLALQVVFGMTVFMGYLKFVTAESESRSPSSQSLPSRKTWEADNTGVNRRDRQQNKLTAEHQARASRKDDEITRRIRENLVKNDEISIYGQNVKIITLGGVVTLRGPVKSESEKKSIARMAQQIQGVTTVQNELEIAN